MPPEAGFDAYNSTVYHAAGPLFDDLMALFENAGLEPKAFDGGKARNFTNRRVAVDAKQHQLFAVKWGGHNPHPHVECTGEHAQLMARFVRKNYRHRPTRIDHAIDRAGEGLFDQLHQIAIALCRQYKLSGKPAGDWVTPDAGRTFYIGSRQSQIFIRIYEKGLKYCHDMGIPLTDDHRNHVRIEIEFKPETKGAKQLAPTITGPEIWGSSRWSDQFAREVLSMATTPVSLRERRESAPERALRYMGVQYQGPLKYLWDQCGGDREEFLWRFLQYVPSIDQEQASQAA